MNRELGPRLKVAVAAGTEFLERDALESVSLATAMTTALLARGVPDSTAALAGELGFLAFKRGFALCPTATVTPPTNSRPTPWRPRRRYQGLHRATVTALSVEMTALVAATAWVLFWGPR